MDKGEKSRGGTGIRRLKKYERVYEEVGRRKLGSKDTNCKTEGKKEKEEEMGKIVRFLVAILQRAINDNKCLIKHARSRVI